MANSLITSQKVVNRALAVLTETPSFLSMVNTQYAGNFGSDVANKVGDTVMVRIPQPAVIRSGRIMDLQPQIDSTIPVQIQQELGVDTGATDAEMALQIDDFQTQFIDPKIPGLLTAVENAVMQNTIPYVARTVGGLTAPSTPAAYAAYNSATLALQAGAVLDANLALKGHQNREMLVNTAAQVDVVTALSTLFNQQGKIGDQYKTGRMSTDTLGFDWDSSNLTPSFTRGTANTAYVTNGTNQTGSSLIVATGSGTINVGDTFVIAGVYDVHPQTKQTLQNLKNFTVTANYAGGAGTMEITPAIIATGPYQNVSGPAANGSAISVKGTSGQLLQNNVAFAKDAFYFVTAKMPVPPKSYGVDAAVATHNGIQLRFMQGYDMTNGMFISRFDIMFGSGILRPELAVRIPTLTTAF